MKKLAHSLIALAAALVVFSGATLQAQTAVGDWGFMGGRIGGWKVTTGLPGNASIGGNAAPTGWSAVRGGFPAPVTATLDQAVIVTGRMEFVGAGFTAWSTLRYGLFKHDSAGVLLYAGTDSARWNGVENRANGYLFTPHSGVNDQVSWVNGGNGTQGVVRNSSWISTFGNNLSMGVINQRPTRAEGTAGLYDFAISVQPQPDGTNEVRFYLVKQDNSYWFGGIVRDTTAITDTFNGVCFAVRSDNGTPDFRALNLSGIQVALGAPIKVPDAPFVAHYVGQWGFIHGNNNRTGGWDFVPGDVIGNAGVAGNQNLNGNWASIRGGFDDVVTATADNAIIVSGKIEFIGAGPSTWSGLRYGLFRHDSAGVVEYADTDSADWSGYESYAYGYMFTPHSGVNDQVSWARGGNGTQGVVRGGVWLSSFGNSHISLGVNNQKPPRAELTAGVYDWAISVQPQPDGSNEVRFYMIKQGTPTTYWYGGIVRDTTAITRDFNGVCFALNGGNGAENNPIRGMNLIDVYVNRGAPIEIPEAPFVAHYVGEWGFIHGNNDRTGGWDFVPGDVTGNAGVAGNQNLNGNWAAIRGGFDDVVTATQENAIVVTGKIEFIGAGPSTWSGLRYGLFRHDSAGVVEYAGTDSADWSGYESYAYGYMFTPHSGVNDQVSWARGGNGTQGVVRGGVWLSSFGNSHISLGVNNQKPPRAELTAGVYDWAISVQPQSDGSNEVRFYMVKQGTPTTYWYGGMVKDTTAITRTFNGVCFALNGGNGAENNPIRGMNLIDVYVNRGKPIEIPEPPFTAFYVENWGVIGNRFGGWTFKPGDVVGNAGISGTAPNTGWAAIRGGFLDVVEPTTTKAVVITGKVEFAGGGFQAANSLRFGVFYSDSAGTLLSTPPDSTRWSGLERRHSGYLFLPQSGTNGPVNWQGSGQMGSWGGVVNDVWFSSDGAASYPLGTDLHKPANAVAGAGTYDFAVSVAPQTDGSNEVRFKLIKSDNSYSFYGKAVDNHSPLAARMFNGVAFALNAGNTTTAMNLVDVYVDLGDPIDIPTSVKEGTKPGIPTAFILGQNYPNPFNPTTTIEFGLPQHSEVKLVVYDLAGRLVSELAVGHFNAGYHAITFDAAHLASGTYYYRLVAGDFVSVKKLMLLK